LQASNSGILSSEERVGKLAGDGDEYRNACGAISHKKGMEQPSVKVA
jgi:hypothetical protein